MFRDDVELGTVEVDPGAAPGFHVPEACEHHVAGVGPLVHQAGDHGVLVDLRRDDERRQSRVPPRGRDAVVAQQLPALLRVHRGVQWKPRITVSLRHSGSSSAANNSGEHHLRVCLHLSSGVL